MAKEIRRRQAALPTLIATRDALNRQIAELEALTDLPPGRRQEDAPAPKKRARRAKRAKNAVSLADTMAAVMKGKGAISIADLSRAVLASGYQTTSKSFSQLVTQVLAKDRRFSRVGRGQYALKG